MGFFDKDGKYHTNLEGCLFCNIPSNINSLKTISRKPEDRVDFENGIFYFNRTFYSRFDRFPDSKGHCEIIPRIHNVKIEDLSSIEFSDFKDAIENTLNFLEKEDLISMYVEFSKKPEQLNKKSKWYKLLSKIPSTKEMRYMAKLILDKPYLNDSFNRTQYIWGGNEGKYAGRTIYHQHTHIIPRYAGDITDPTGVIRNVLPDVGNYKKIIVPKDFD
jgi:diadenosine tetraphosphate (Ap4A) HIT family hydrolase